jgi:bacteriophage HK97-gp10 putative tail-component
MVIVRAQVSFNTVYAAYQHERTDLEHPRGGKAKYLEGALLTHAPEFAEFVAARVRAAVKGAGLIRSAADLAKIQVDAAEEAVGAFAEIVAGEAQRDAPVLKGVLRASAEVTTGRVRAPG